MRSSLPLILLVASTGLLAAQEHSPESPPHQPLTGNASPQIPQECTSHELDRTSLHAAVLFETLLEEPRMGKESRVYLCGDQPVTVYLYHYHAEEAAQDQVGFKAARLWGGSTPTSTHRDELLRKGSIIAILSPEPGVLGPALEAQGFIPQRPDRLGPGKDALARDVSQGRLDLMKNGLGCPSPEHQVFCDVLDRFATGTPVVSPKEPLALAGASLLVTPGMPLRLEASSLVISTSGARYRSITPDNPGEQEQITRFLNQTVAGGPLAPTNPVVTYARSLVALPVTPTTTVGQSTTYQSTNHVFLRQHGALIMAVEITPHSPAFYVGFFRMNVQQ